MKKALIITTISGFLLKFEQDNVKILQDMGYEVHYAANGHEQMYRYEDGAYENIGVHFHHIDIAKSPFKVFKNLKALRQLCELVRKEEIRLIHCHTPVGGVLGRLTGAMCKKMNVHVIYTSHGYHFYKGASKKNNAIYYFIEKTMARYSDTIILINKEDYENTLKFRLKKDGKVFQIPGIGLDTKRFKPVNAEERNRLRQKLKIDENKFFVLSVGELNENKNHRIVLEALELLRSEGVDLSLIHYGICGDGPYRDKLEELIKSMNLESTVTAFGYCTDVKEYIGAADITVFPSEREGLGMAALESLAMGVPVIASDNRGTREYMVHGKNGYVCSYNDAVGFAENIKKLMNLSHFEKSKMSLDCVDSVKAFDKSKTHEKMTEIYQQID